MDKYQAALIRYAKARNEVLRLKAAIGEAFSDCYSEYMTTRRDAVFYDFELHIKKVYAIKIEEDGGCYDYERHLYDSEARAELEGNGEDPENACPHCLKAHILIQERKTAKRALARTRGVLTRMANELLKQEKTA